MISLTFVTETKVSKDLCKKEAKLRRSLKADGLEKKLQIEELMMKIHSIETEKKTSI